MKDPQFKKAWWTFVVLLFPFCLTAAQDSTQTSNQKIRFTYDFYFHDGVVEISRFMYGRDTIKALRDRMVYSNGPRLAMEQDYFYIGNEVYNPDHADETPKYIGDYMQVEKRYRPQRIQIGFGDTATLFFSSDRFDTAYVRFDHFSYKILPLHTALRISGDTLVFVADNLLKDYGLKCRLVIQPVVQNVFAGAQHDAAVYHKSFSQHYRWAMQYLFFFFFMWWFWWVVFKGKRHKVIPDNLADPVLKWTPYISIVFFLASMSHFMNPEFVFFIKLPGDELRVNVVLLTALVLVLCLGLLHRFRFFKNPYLNKLVFQMGYTCVQAMTVYLVFFIGCYLSCVLQPGVKSTDPTLSSTRLTGYNGLGIIMEAIVFFGIAFVLYRFFSFNRWMRWISLLLLFVNRPMEIFDGRSYVFSGTNSVMLFHLSQQNISILFLAPLLFAGAYYRTRWKLPALFGEEWFSLKVFAFLFIVFLGADEGFFAFIPVALLLYCWLVPRILTMNRRQLLLQWKAYQTLVSVRYPREWFEKIILLRHADKAAENYRKKWTAGDLTHGDYEKRLADMRNILPEGADREIILSKLLFPPQNNPVKSGLWMGAVAAMLAAAISVLTLNRQFDVRRSYEMWQSGFGNVLSLFIAGFLLGAIYPYIRGRFGWEKGLRMGMMIFLAQSACFVLTLADGLWVAIGDLLTNGVLVLFICGLAMDYKILKSIYQERFKFGYLFSVLGWSGIISLFAVAIGTAGQGVIGGLLDLIKKFLGSFFH